MKNKIIIVGYPKSGNTWLCRLTAQTINCPVVGFWKSDHYEIAVEGNDRISDFECYKSHHQFSELNLDEIYKIIYIIRDPRDILYSGIGYFNFIKGNYIDKLFKLSYGHYIISFIKRVSNSKFGFYYKKKRLKRAIFFGDIKLQEWLSVSWEEHVIGYQNKNILFIRYEDLLKDPLTEMKKLVKYLSLDIDNDHILKSIELQSFSNKKRKFESEGDKLKANFLRSGISGSWKNKLSLKERIEFKSQIGNTMSMFNYN